VEGPEEQFEFNEEYAEFMNNFEPFTESEIEGSPYGWSGIPEGVFNYSINSVENDEFGEYTRVKVSLRDEYIDAIPLEYLDVDASWDGTKMVGNSSTRPIEDLTEEEVREALRFYTDFVLNETLDSIALDNPYRYEEWLDTVGSEYFTSQLLEQSKEAFIDPFGYDGYLDDSEFSGPLIEKYGPPYGDRLFSENVTPGLLHDSGFDADKLMIDEGYNVSWGGVSKPMVRDGGSRNGVRHLYSIHMMDATASVPALYVWSRFHVRNSWPLEEVEEHVGGSPIPEEGFYSHDTSGDIGYTLIKIDGEWKISGYTLEKRRWNAYLALGDDAFEAYPEWADSKWLERPELRYPEVTR
jgi:hypothetical protein